MCNSVSKWYAKNPDIIPCGFIEDYNISHQNLSRC